MSKPLTIQLVQQKTKTDSLASIKNLNLWGNDIDDLKVLRQLPNLEVLSLSVNRISTLKEIATCTRLKELYLRKNHISELTELRYVQHLPSLKVLWLQGNFRLHFNLA
jgi:Leucine-rich repeat (LRR) protein